MTSATAGSAPLGWVTTEEDLVSTQGASAAAANLAFFAVALGVAGAVLGVTVVWFFAAIPLGLAAAVTGGLALRRRDIGRHRTRAVLGTVLGLVAVLLGILSAILLPVIFHRADEALTGVRDDVTAQIDKIDSSLAGDVDRLDLTITRELRNLEQQNHRELTRFQKTSADELHRLERRLAAAEKGLPAQQDDLGRLERQLRVELAALGDNTKGAGAAVQTRLEAISARVLALEGQPDPSQLQAGAPVAPQQTDGTPGP
jgi:F0F1-type ATP synthase membrane subunit c/vacuolar-type H+-ATPase subunit K